jgi:hypothetical protein
MPPPPPSREKLRRVGGIFYCSLAAAAAADNLGENSEKLTYSLSSPSSLFPSNHGEISEFLPFESRISRNGKIGEFLSCPCEILCVSVVKIVFFASDQQLTNIDF